MKPKSAASRKKALPENMFSLMPKQASSEQRNLPPVIIRDLGGLQSFKLSDAVTCASEASLNLVKRFEAQANDATEIDLLTRRI